MSDKQLTEIVQELKTVRKLLVLNTIKSGASQDEVARLLAVTDRTVRNILAGKSD